MAANWYAQWCAEVYWSMRNPQLDREESWAIGYSTDIGLFYESETRITFKDILIQCGQERRARMADKLAC